MKHASKVLVFGGLKNHRTLVRFSSTKAISNKGFSGNSSILPRIKFRVGGQVSSPQSLTAYSLSRYSQW
jgi:hypothetical protein